MEMQCRYPSAQESLQEESQEQEEAVWQGEVRWEFQAAGEALESKELGPPNTYRAFQGLFRLRE